MLAASSLTNAGVIKEANMTPMGEAIAKTVVTITRWTPENQF